MTGIGSNSGPISSVIGAIGNSSSDVGRLSARFLPTSDATRTYLPAAAGMAGIVASAVIADVWAIRTARPTVSSTVATLLEHNAAGPVVIGALAALGWHLAVDPVVRRLERA